MKTLSTIQTSAANDVVSQAKHESMVNHMVDDVKVKVFELAPHVQKQPDVRRNKVAALRSMIQSGAYDQDSVMDVVVDRLWEDLQDD